MNAPSLRIVVVMLVFACGIARAASFTFADNNGAPYCDSIRITKSGGLVGGVIDSEACKPAGKTIGAGVESRLPGEPTKRVSFGYSLKKYAVLFLLDTQALTWAMYVSSRADGYSMQKTQNGLLLRGGADARPGGASVLRGLAK